MAKKLVIKDSIVENIIEASDEFSIDGCKVVDYQDGANIGYDWDGEKVIIPEPTPVSEEEVRFQRNDLLAASDWTQANDSPLSTEVKTSWATYRTALRDLPSHSNWPSLEDSDWPTKPSQGEKDDK